MTDEQLHQQNKTWHEENESEYGESEEGVTKDLANDVAIQNAHDANRECNTASPCERERESR